VLPTFEIEPTEAHRGTVIWLHGIGATNRDYEPVVPELKAGYLRFVFPQAPLRPVTINQGMRMPAWFDILAFDNPPLLEKETDVRSVNLELLELVEREHSRGVRYEDIVVAGFSQGGAMALHTALRTPHPLAGILVLSSYMVLPQHLEAERTAENLSTPILFCHGRYDSVIPHALGVAAYQRIVQAGHPAEMAEFDMEHTFCVDELATIEEWLRERFPNSPQ
jgi:phospholipase/carboxylesterase